MFRLSVHLYSNMRTLEGASWNAISVESKGVIVNILIITDKRSLATIALQGLNTDTYKMLCPVLEDLFSYYPSSLTFQLFPSKQALA